MKILYLLKLLLRPLLLLIVPYVAVALPLVQHELDVVLLAEQGQIQVNDKIQLPPELTGQPFCWSLQAGLEPTLENAVFVPADNPPSIPQQNYFCVSVKTGSDYFTVSYRGPVSHPQLPVQDERQRSPINPAGAYLTSASAWYPHTNQALISFQMTLTMPPHWRAVTQGERQQREITTANAVEIWQEANPQEEIVLVATEFQEYEHTFSGALQDKEIARALVFLREPDSDLAQRYLQTTEQFLEFYNNLLGPYAYSKFALVENFWESGYGLPSFTLLGPRVMRFPFILYTSYPHEILHSWWGNSVYVDYQSGNWAEGLTTYLADYLIKERQGRGTEFRRDSLQRYGNFVRNDKDFPLSRFGTRHNDIAQSVGYDKSLMFFHMLRQRLGDRTFLAGLQRFYRQYRFQRAGFAELQYVFEQISGESLSTEFSQWVDSTGVPELKLHPPRVQRHQGSYQLTAILEQIQPGPAYQLRVPVAVQLDREQAWQSTVTVNEKKTQLILDLPGEPQRLVIDPEFDLMRRLHSEEVPPSLSRLFGNKNSLIILASDAPETLQQAHRDTAERWAARYNAEIVRDDELNTLPNDRSIWLFGWENRFRKQLAEYLNQDASTTQANLTSEALQLDTHTFTRDQSGNVLVTWHPQNRQQTLAWVAWEQPERFAAMTRKLRHYGKYSYLSFTGQRAQNQLKGQWSITESPLNRAVLDSATNNPNPQPWQARLAPRSVLANIPIP